MNKLNSTLILFAVVLLYNCIGSKKITHELTYQIRTDSVQTKENKAICFLDIHIDGHQQLFNEPWKIYFNSYKKPYIASSDSMHYGIQSVNGDLHFIYPKHTDRGYASKKSLTIALGQQIIKNISDFPLGFYLIQEKAPTEYHIIANSDPNYESITIADNRSAETLFDRYSKLHILKDDELCPLMPTPKSYRTNTDTYTLDKHTAIILDKNFKQEAEFFSDEIRRLTGFDLKITEDVEQDGIKLIYWNLPEEAYQLRITQEGIEVSAGSASGIFYGLQSLKSLVLQGYKDNRVTLKGVEIEDEPRYGHRAVMIDVARNFQTKESLLQTLDMMANYKVNKLHLHFNDDEGWRLEIQGLPELTEYGAVRGAQSDTDTHLPPSYGSGPDIKGNFGSGYYSRADFIEILRYAKERHITIIPEIETPGHARAAIKAMEYRYRKHVASDPERAKEFLLSDPDDKSIYRSVQGWSDNAINVALPSVYTFIDHVIADLNSMYQEAGLTLKAIHMGGDEVPAGVWDKSPIVQKFMRQNPQYRSVDDLWRYFFDRTQQILTKHDITLHGWEEIGMKRVDVHGRKKMQIIPSLANNNMTLDVWNNIYTTGNEDLAYRLANQNFRIVLSNVTHLYMDLAANDNFYEPGMFWGGYTDEEKPFSFMPENYFRTFYYDDMNRPIPPDAFDKMVLPTKSGLDKIIGLQTAIWSETLIDEKSFDYMVFPKMIAFAERAWAASPTWTVLENKQDFDEAYRASFSRFMQQLYAIELKKLSTYYPTVHYRIPTPGARIVNGKLMLNTVHPQYEIYYTDEQRSPSNRDNKYISAINKKGTYRFKSYDPLTLRYSRMSVVEFK